MRHVYEYDNIRAFYRNLPNDRQNEILFELKQLEGIVLNQITVPDLPDYLINNFILILKYLDKLIADQKMDHEHYLKLKDLIRDDIIALKEHHEFNYGIKRTFGEYMNYVYNVVDFIDSI